MTAGIGDTDLGDAELMNRVRWGDEVAFGELMSRWERPVKAVIGRVVLNATDARELAQETFVRVWQQREKFQPGAEFRPWIFSIALNLARNRLRWWKRRPLVELGEWSEAGEAGGTAGSTGAAVDAERRERAAAVRDAIDALPLQLREALVLFEYEEMSHAEIAAALGVTPKAVETRIHRAREKLRTALSHLLCRHKPALAPGGSFCAQSGRGKSSPELCDSPLSQCGDDRPARDGDRGAADSRRP